MIVQAPVSGSHRSHVYVNVVGEPDHVPVDATSLDFVYIGPVTVGSVRLVGAVEVDAEGADATTADAALVATAEPPAFVAVTATRIVEPTSTNDNTKLDAVAPATGEHDDPALEHRCH